MGNSSMTRHETQCVSGPTEWKVKLCQIMQLGRTVNYQETVTKKKKVFPNYFPAVEVTIVALQSFKREFNP